MSMKYIILLLVALLCQASPALGAEEAKKASAGVGRELTPEEIEEHRKDFVDFDLNNDGQIDAHEIRSSFRNDIQPKELYKFFSDVDKDNSGTVTMEEYIQYASTMD